MNVTRRRFLQHAIAATAAVHCRVGGQSVLGAEAVEQDVRTIPIIDTHQHLWDLEQISPPWLADADPVLRARYTTDEYRQAVADLPIERTIYMEIDAAPEDHVREAEYVIALAASKDYPTVAAVISGRPNSDQFSDYIRPLAKSPYVKGLRQILHAGTPRGYCLDPAFVRGIQLLGDLGLSFDLCMRPTELGDGAVLAERCPGTRFIVDHCGNADPLAFAKAGHGTLQPSHGADQWKRDMERLAARDNVICKISGIVARAPRPTWSASDLAPIVNFCLDTFGPERVIFGSDWPVCRLRDTLKAWVESLYAIIAERPMALQRGLLYANAERWYDLPPAEDPTAGNP